MLPNFLVIGAAKCGTTSLWKYLDAHPDIFMSPKKEICFFNRQSEYNKGLEHYEIFFRDWQGQKMVGEASHQYSQSEQFPDVADRIKHMLGDIKLIYIVRHPIQRIESAWRQADNSKLELTSSFNEDIVRDPWYKSPSLYWQQINEYREFWCDQSIHVVFLEDLMENPVEVMKAVYIYLGIDSSFIDKNIGFNYKPSGKRRVNRKLTNYSNNTFFYKWLSKRISGRVKSGLKKISTIPVSKTQTWNKETYDFLISEIEIDAIKFLSYYGKPTEYWRF